MPLRAEARGHAAASQGTQARHGAMPLRAKTATAPNITFTSLNKLSYPLSLVKAIFQRASKWGSLAFPMIVPHFRRRGLKPSL